MAETNQKDQIAQPGAVIGPSGSMPPMPDQPVVVPQLPVPVTPPPALSAPAETITDYNPLVTQQSRLSDLNQMPASLSEGDSYSWTAAEFIAHHKTPQWFIVFGGVSVIIIAFMYLITKDITAVLALLVGAVAVGVFAGRIPKNQQYQIDRSGFSIGEKRFHFEQFKSFSVTHEGLVGSVQFLPLKRFATYKTIYFGQSDEKDVLDRIENALPYVEHVGDPIDQLLRRVRF